MNITPYKFVSLEELEDALCVAPLFFDTETDGFYGEIILAQFFQEDWHEVLIVERPNAEKLAKLLVNEHLIIHNASYDISTVQANLGRYWKPNKYDDTFLLSRLHYYTKDKFSLDEVFKYTLGYDPYEEQGLNKKELQKSKWNKELTHDQLVYAATDVYYMPAVWQQVLIAKDTYSYKLDKITLNYCLDFQCNGMPVDLDLLEARRNENIKKIQDIDCPVNPNSPKQVQEMLNVESSAALTLIRLFLDGNENARKVFDSRKLLKQNSFLNKFEAEGERIRGRFSPSTRSGRLSCKDQNLQQLPRSLKGIFGFPENSDKVMIYSDFAQLEIRSICALTGERAMEKVFRLGGDLHQYTAEMLFGKDANKDQRQVAKTANFGLLYGAGVPVFGDILMNLAHLYVPESELAETKRKWLNLWSGIAKWQRKKINDWRNDLPSATPLGRRYTGGRMTDYLNIQNQGFGAEIAKLALHYMYPKLQELHSEIKVLNFIHDSYILECPNDEKLYKKASEIVADSMQEAWRESTKGVAIKDLPMPVEVFVGNNWGSIEDDYIYKLDK